MVNEDIERIDETNRVIKERSLNWVAGLNPIAILSEEEKRRLCGLLPLTKELREKYPPVRIKKFDLPSSLDWRDKDGKNWMTPIKYQQCGDCWAHGTCGSMEAKIKIMENNPELDINLSEQQLVSCCDECGSCSGAQHLAPSFQYAIDTGIVDENCFPYMGSDVSCSLCSDWENRVNKINSFLNLSNEDLKEALVLYGPVEIGMEVRSDFFDYVGGIYEPTSSYVSGYHAIVLLGYNDDEEYWILKNSWGTGWGEEGWFRMSYNAGIELFMNESVVDGDEVPVPPPPTPTILPYLLGGAALLALPMIIKPKKKIPKEKDKTTRNLLIGGGLILGGIILVSALRPPTPPAPGKAKINVYSVPKGASTYLNENYIGITPVYQYEIDPGTYTLKLTLGGYQDYTETFTISEGETRTFEITLTPGVVSAEITEFTITA